MIPNGARVLFRSSADLGMHGPVISRYHKHTAEVIRPLTEDEADAEVGPMYRLRFDDGHEDDAFADEIEVVR